MKKIVPIILAVIVFVVAFLALGSRTGKQADVVMVRRDLPAGHTIVADDIEVVQAPVLSIPEDAFTKVALLLGETLRIDRTSGDMIRPAHLGGQTIELAADERAVAVEVTDSAGLAGLLKEGDTVGITAVLVGSNSTYAKVVSEDLRVLFVSPEFRSLDPSQYVISEESGGFGSGGSTVPVDRENRGVVVLAVPTNTVLIAYDFAAFGVDSDARTVNVVDLLPALDHAKGVELSLFLQPDNASKFVTSGVDIQTLVITPAPSPTPSPDDGVEESAEVLATSTPMVP